MVIWYLHHYAGSPELGMSHRPYFMTKAFNAAGHQAYVWAANFHHLLKSPPVVMLGDAFCQQYVEGVPYIWLKCTHYSGNGVARVMNMLSYAYQILRQGWKKRAQPQAPSHIIVSTPHPFHILSAWCLAKRYRAKLILEVRDIWPESLQAISGWSKFHPMVILLRLFEWLSYFLADGVVTLLPRLSDYIKERGLPHGFETAYIPNGTTLEATQASAPVPDGLQSHLNDLALKQAFVVLYAGAHGVVNDLEQLLEAMAVLKAKPHNVHIIFMGDGVYKKDLIAKAQKLDLEDRVRFFSPVSKSVLFQVATYCDAAFFCSKDNATHQYGISFNKIFDYMLMKKPVIQAFDYPSDAIESANCGVFVAAHHPEKLAQTLLEVSAWPKEKLAAMGLRGECYVKHHHLYPVLAKKYTEFLARVSQMT